MKNILISTITLLLCLSAAAQNKYGDWADFGRYSAANAKPHAVFMGDSITDNWARYDADFFTSHNFAGRGISGQTTSQMLVRFRKDVIDLSATHSPDGVHPNLECYRILEGIIMRAL